MNVKVKAMLAANQVGWTRARILCEFVDESTPSQARSFLSEHKKGPYPGLLEGDNCDKRNPTVRNMIKEFAEYCKNNKGKAGRKNGEATKPETPTGITNPRIRRAHLIQKRTRKPNISKIMGQTKPTIDHETLIKLRAIAEEFGGIENLQNGLEILKGLQLK